MIVIWHPTAERDLQSLSDYIVQDNPSAALSVFHQVVTTAEQLAGFPNLGHEGRVHITRELLVTGLPYYVIYRLSKNAVHVVAVQHTSRLWPESFSIY